jgi:hypothetical protein
MPCSPDISPWDMPGIDMFEVATLIQYWVRGFFGSAADAEAAKQATIIAVTAQAVLLRRFMVHTSLEKICLVSFAMLSVSSKSPADNGEVA